jgi:hypothetical protein
MAKKKAAAIKCAQCGKELTPQQAGEPCPECGNRDRNLNAQEQAVVTEKVKAAKELAAKHYQVEAGLKRIFRITGTAEVEAVPAEPIKLLEVNENTVPSGVMPLGFDAAPAAGIPFPSVIIEVTPSEFEQIQTKELKLPNGWGIADEIPKP